MENNQPNQPLSDPTSTKHETLLDILTGYIAVPMFAFAGSMLIVIGLLVPTGCTGIGGTCLGPLVQHPYETLRDPNLELVYVYRSAYIFLISGALGILLFALSMRNHVAVRLAVGMSFATIGLYFIQSLIAMDEKFMQQFEDAVIPSQLAGGWWFILAGSILLVPCLIFRQRPKYFYTDVYQPEVSDDDLENRVLFAIRLAILGTIVVGAGSLRLLTLTNVEHGIRGIFLMNSVGLTMLTLMVFGGVAIQIGRSSAISIVGLAGLFQCFVLKTIGGSFSLDNLVGIGLISLLVGSSIQVVGGIMIWLAIYGEQSLKYEEEKRQS